MRASSMCPCVLLAVFTIAAAQSQCGAQDCEPEVNSKLTASDDDAFNRFGQSVSMDGNTLLSGSPFGDIGGTDTGAVHVYEKIDGVWIETDILIASDGATMDFFGFSVFIHGDVAVVGARNDDDRGPDSGSVYVFERNGGAWNETAKLTASDGSSNDVFGISVFIQDDFIVVGAIGDSDQGTSSGSVYLFEKIGGVWTEVEKLLASNGRAYDFFGAPVARQGNMVLVGARLDDDLGNESGSIFIFKLVDGEWVETGKLLASDGAAEDEFGEFTWQHNTLLVGSYADDDNALNSGSAYVYTYENGNWTETAKLTPSDPGVNHYFGRSVSLDGDAAVIGAFWDDELGSFGGSAYLFERTDGVWTEVAKFLAADGEGGDEYGTAVAASHGTAAVGSPFGGDAGLGGAVYLYDLNCGPTLSTLGSCPGPMRFKVEGATNNGRVAYLYARGEGSVIIPPGNPCAGTQLGLNATVQLVGVERADENGTARLDVDNVPNAACGRIYMQAIELTTCTTTNVIRL